MLGNYNIDQICASVADFDGSLKFYRDTLELELLFEKKDQKYAGFNVGAFTLVILENSREASSGGARIFFTVDRIEYLRNKLKDAGISTSTIYKRGAAKYVDFSDPDGNRLGLVQPPVDYEREVEDPLLTLEETWE